MAAVSPSGAADIPAAQPYKAPIAVPMKQSWYGFYIGANAGYAWGNNSVEFGPDAFYGAAAARRRAYPALARR